jgi:hypothetical protein
MDPRPNRARARQGRGHAIDTLLCELRSNAAEAELEAASEIAVALRRVVDKLS